MAVIGVYGTEKSLIGAVNKIPVADGTGKLDLSWLSGIAVGFFGPTAPADPLPNAINLWNDTTANQIKIWTGTGWVTIA